METMEATIPTKEERTWALAAHLSALIALVGVPLGNILGPLIVWLIKKDTSEFVADQGKEALNAQLSLTLYVIIAGATMLILIGWLILPVVIVAGVVLTIIGGVKANDGIRYRYPWIIRFIK